MQSDANGPTHPFAHSELHAWHPMKSWKWFGGQLEVHVPFALMYRHVRHPSTPGPVQPLDEHCESHRWHVRSALLSRPSIASLAFALDSFNDAGACHPCGHAATHAPASSKVLHALQLPGPCPLHPAASEHSSSQARHLRSCLYSVKGSHDDVHKPPSVINALREQTGSRDVPSPTQCSGSGPKHPAAHKLLHSTHAFNSTSPYISDGHV